jgi:transposase InsO family protein
VQVASALGLVVATLKRWLKGWKEDHLAVELRGRPAERGKADRRNELLAYLTAVGPDVSVAALRDAFPDLSRAEIRDLRRRWWRIARKGEYCRLLHALGWTIPGSVWAMDFTQPHQPVDGLFPYVFVVRDLASGRHLAAMPVKAKDTVSARDVLEALFLWHPPPLVLKCDNDKAFKTGAIAALLEANGVVALYSPPYLPSYNGACEAGIGTLKTFVHHEAAAHGRPGAWTSDDLFAAVRRGNELTRPRGPGTPTPEEAWRESTGIIPWDRVRFRRRYEKEYRNELERLGLPTLFPIEPSKKEAVDRVAIGRALIKCGFLSIKRRRVYPPISPRKRCNISSA